MDLEPFECKIYSQNGEDGITIKLIDLIYTTGYNKFYVELGVQNGIECNTRILRELFKWEGLQMDGGNENIDINLQCEFITKENVIELFQKYNVPANINVLSVDIDFNNFYCLKEILKHYVCDIIICEYNATHLPNEDKIIIYDRNGGWDGYHNYFGASLLSLKKLMEMYNYSLIYCDNQGVNCFFLRNDIINEKFLHFKNFRDIEKIYKRGRHGSGKNGGHTDDPHDRKYITFEEAINL
jgi:hypothetical protein